MAGHGECQHQGALQGALLTCSADCSAPVNQLLQGVTSPALCMQVPLSSSGSLVYKTDPLAPAHDVLRENDVLVEMDGVQIADGELHCCYSD